MHRVIAGVVHHDAVGGAAILDELAAEGRVPLVVATDPGQGGRHRHEHVVYGVGDDDVVVDGDPGRYNNHAIANT